MSKREVNISTFENTLSKEKFYSCTRDYSKHKSVKIFTLYDCTNETLCLQMLKIVQAGKKMSAAITMLQKLASKQHQAANFHYSLYMLRTLHCTANFQQRRKNLLEEMFHMFAVRLIT